ncbi:MAG: putative porin [Bacteroidales bacterium]|nr:putative porin [Bacteroidales bacterium]
MRPLFILLLLVSISVFAQEKTNNLSIYSWTVSPKLGEETRTDVDTIPLDFQHYDTGDGYRSPRGYLGNLGSPSYSKVFFEQREYSRFLFSQAFEPFFLSAEKAKFYNTTIPLMNITYLTGGGSKSSEERFKATFAANSGKKLNLGGEIENIYARGFYAAQGVNDFTYRLFGSYTSDRYVMHTFFGNSNLSNQENGGISNDLYITKPSSLSSGTQTVTSENIPVYLNETWNRVNGGVFFLTHRYNIGFTKTETKDTSEIKTFIPISSIIHTFEYNNIDRRFISKSLPTGYFAHNYISDKYTNDTTSYHSYRNTVALSLREGFNKFALFGLTAYLQNDIRSYSIMNVGGFETHTEQSTFLGGEISRRNGKLINYQAIGELGVLGKDLGQMTLIGNLETRLQIFKKEVRFKANGFIKNLNPGFYLNTYHSNHFWWDNNAFQKERRVRVEGEISIPEKHFLIKAGVENLQNYIYFNNESLPTQESGNIQILSGCLSKDFKLGKFHFDNQIYGQYSSNQDVIPLPTVSLYHNLYVLTKLANVLTFQIGADVRYHSAYYALDYQPALSQFHTQNQIKIGNYPLACAYVNMFLKRTRFYIMYYHVDKGLVEPNYFSTPHYPINPMFMKVGVSWNFNN